MDSVSVPGSVSGTVPATLALELTPTANLGAFLPGIGRQYETSVGATITSSAADSTLSVADPSPDASGRLVNGSFELSEPLEARAMSNPFAAITDDPLTLLTYTGPVSADQVTITLRQTILADEALRTGRYSKTLTFTLSTTMP